MRNSGSKPDRILASNVRGARFAAELSSFTQHAFGVTPEYPHAQAKQLGVTNGYQEPTRLGIDRWLGLIAARHEDLRPSLLVGSGTALTIDALTGQGQHLGGLIAPGMRILTALQASDPSTAIVSLIRRALAALQAYDPPTTPRLVLAGGDARALAPYFDATAELREDLVLSGLAQLALSATKPA